MKRIAQWSNRALFGAAALAAKTWPLAARIFPETLEIDDNQSLWVAQTPDYRPNPPLQKPISCDLAIIGGGFTGVSTAYHFSRRYPQKRVVLLEAKTLANGASGRNGGMLLNWVTDPLAYSSDEMVQRIYQTTHAGIQTILDIIKRHQLNVSHRLDGTVHVITHPDRVEAAQEEAAYYNSLDIPVQFLEGDALKPYIELEGVYAAMIDPNSGQLNGAQLVRELRPVLEAQGVAIYEQTPVIRIEEGREITLRTPQAEVRAKAIVLATNGYTGKLGYFRDALFPLHSHVFATEALSPEQLNNIGWQQLAGYEDDLDRIAYSTLTREGHIVFGGGSNASYAYLFRNRTAYPNTPHSAQSSFTAMRKTMSDYLPRSADIPLAHRWTGTLGITLRRNNLMGVTGEHRNVYYALGYCGHGVTLANMAGMVLTDLYSGDDERWRGLPFYMPQKTIYDPIPPEPFRWLGYQLFTRLTGKSPRTPMAEGMH